MCVCQFIVAIVGVSTTSTVANKVLIAFVCIYIFFFACSWGPVAWVVTGELFPLKVRAKALSMTTATNWLLNWAIAYSTPYLVSSGPGNANLQVKVFFIWGTCCFVCIAFVYFFIYETKSLTLEQVDEMYEKVDKAYKSKHFVPSINFREIEEEMAQNRKQSLAEVEQVILRKKSVAAGTGGVAEHRDAVSGDEKV
jgi:hypothetical protein